MVEGNAASSLTNVCRWASASTTPDDDAPEHHDFAAFITKRSFGPAGKLKAGLPFLKIYLKPSVTVILLSIDLQSALIVSKEPENTLRRFCHWAALENTPDDTSPKHYDYAALMERVYNEEGDVIGGGM